VSPQDRDLEVREVVSEDPSLSPDANRILTEEARAAVGADRVRVPRDTPHTERDRHGEHSGFGEALAANRVLIAITFFALLVVGAIAALATGSWWAVVVAAVIHAIGTFVVLSTLASAARQTEHVSPTAAAKLAEEGVADPDATLSDLVEEYSGIDSGDGSAEMVTTGRNEQPSDPLEDPARAATEQRTANTPAGVPTRPAGTGSGIDRFMPKGVVAALMVVAVVVGALAPLIGIRFLIVPAIGLPLGAIWLLLQARMSGRREEEAGSAGERSSSAPASRLRVLAIMALTIVAVAAFVVLMGWVSGEL
jgi:hypothetical protein